MQANELDKILAELYQFEPGLRDFEIELKSLIGQMSDLRPDTHFTPDLAAQIKIKLMQRLSENSPSNKIFTFNIMNKKILMAASAVFGVAVIVLLINLAMPLSPDNSTGKTLSQSLKDSISSSPVEKSDGGVIRLAAKAFGSLSAESQGSISPAISDGKVVIENSREVTMSDSAASDLAIYAPSITAVAPTQVLGLGGGGVNASTKMIAPWYNFKYVYRGENLSLGGGEADVYRRIYGDASGNRELATLLSGFSFSGISLTAFSNLTASNLSLQENKDKGLALNFDFINDTVNIYENWQRWQLPERDACGNDDACWQRFRLKISDVPADADLIAQANKFLADHKINLEHYGVPSVDNSWRDNYNITEDKVNFYIPEYASVVYPLLVDGSPVRDQSGNLAGMRVNINLLQKAVSGVNNLIPYRYEVSTYPLADDSAEIIRYAENGGWNHNYYGGTETTKEIGLDTPTKSYIQLNRYTNGHNEELLVPALVFPVILPADTFYYGPASIIVPLPKELLSEQTDGVQIMPMVKAAK